MDVSKHNYSLSMASVPETRLTQKFQARKPQKATNPKKNPKVSSNIGSCHNHRNGILKYLQKLFDPKKALDSCDFQTMDSSGIQP